jgi:predicted TIM-barrel fold metal-dependent hydrolase
MFKPPSAPGFIMPAGSCDCHVHLFGPYDRYPLSKQRLYTPAPAQMSDLLSMLDRTGVARAVLVQPSAYADDNQCQLGALAAHPDRFRVVAVIDPATESDELQRLHALGVRGVRLNLASSGGRSGAETARLVKEMAARIAPFGWHLQMFVSIATIAEIAPLVRALPVDVVFDHMGMAEAARGTTQPDLTVFLKLLDQGRAWVKLSGPYRVSADEYGNADVVALARTLVAANPDRAVWGSDWPHIGKHAHSVGGEAPPVAYRPLDYGRLLATLAEWVSGDDLARVLARNPAKLYGFA